MPALLHIPEVWPGPPHRVSTEFLIGQLSTHSGRKSYRSQRRSRSRPGPPRHRSLPRLPSSRSGPEPPRRSSRPAEPLIRSAPSPPVRVSFPLPPEIESALDPPRTVSEPASPRRVCRSTASAERIAAPASPDGVPAPRVARTLDSETAPANGVAIVWFAALRCCLLQGGAFDGPETAQKAKPGHRGPGFG